MANQLQFGPMAQRVSFYIGIDTGVHTGVAVWDKKEKKFIQITTMPIHVAMEFVIYFHQVHGNIKVIIEDARKKGWYTKTREDEKTMMARQQGVGSVRRDAKIWEDFLTDKKIPFEMVAPKNGQVKWDEATFRTRTKWAGKTSNHARDAAVLVWGY